MSSLCSAPPRRSDNFFSSKSFLRTPPSPLSPPFSFLPDCACFLAHSLKTQILFYLLLPMAPPRTRRPALLYLRILLPVRSSLLQAVSSSTCYHRLIARSPLPLVPTFPGRDLTVKTVIFTLLPSSFSTPLDGRNFFCPNRVDRFSVPTAKEPSCLSYFRTPTFARIQKIRVLAKLRGAILSSLLLSARMCFLGLIAVRTGRFRPAPLTMFSVSRTSLGPFPLRSDLTPLPLNKLPFGPPPPINSSSSSRYGLTLGVIRVSRPASVFLPPIP